MKNPIRTWITKIIREEIHAMHWERNMKAIQDEIQRSLFTADLDAGRASIKRRREAKS